jgi:ribonuclease VapC
MEKAGIRRQPLNFCDCIAYALAKTNDARLLFKGSDFAATDVKACI